MKSNEKLSGGMAALNQAEEFVGGPNQRNIDAQTNYCRDFVKHKPCESMRGAFAQYANPELREKEKDAWERAAAEKHLRFRDC